MFLASQAQLQRESKMSDEDGNLSQNGSAERSTERDVGSNPTPGA